MMSIRGRRGLVGNGSMFSSCTTSHLNRDDTLRVVTPTGGRREILERQSAVRELRKQS